VLTGTEVKALRDGKATLQQAYADVRDGEAWLIGLHVPEYGQGNRENHEPDRPRKLLLHRREIDRLYTQVREKCFTLVPTRLYFKDGKVKAEIAVDLTGARSCATSGVPSPIATPAARSSASSSRAASHGGLCSPRGGRRAATGP
jgi:hypothetical protein